MNIVKIARFQLFLLMICAAVSANAAWTYDSSAKTLTQGSQVIKNVTLSDGKLTIGDNKSNADVAGDIDLSSGTGYSVKLGDNCFKDNSSITGIKTGVELIGTGNSAFSGCSSLTNADMSGSTSLTALSSSLFNNCQNLKKAAIPSTITSIGTTAFRDCKELEMDVNDLLPSGLSGSLYRTFYSSPKLYGDVVLPAGVTAISGDFAYSAITSFRTAEGSVLATIGEFHGYAEDATFNRCRSITNIVFHDTIKTFYGKNNHFCDCTNLVNITLPGITVPSTNVVSGGGGTWGNTFRDCAVLTNSITIPDDVDILNQTFDGAKSIRGMTLGAGLTRIGNYNTAESVFTDNFALEYVDMSRATNLLEIGKMNFSQCMALTELTIPDSVTNIGESAFANCIAMTNLVLPAGLQRIQSSAVKNVGKNSHCDIWWRGAPEVPLTGLGTKSSIMGYDEGASYRLTHYFRIEDFDYWTEWASTNSTYITLPAVAKRAAGTWKDHNSKTQYIKWWFKNQGYTIILK